MINLLYKYNRVTNNKNNLAIKTYQMSRKRNRHLSLSSILDRTDSTLKGRTKPIFGVSTTKSFYIPNKNSTLSNGKRVDFTDHGR